MSFNGSGSFVINSSGQPVVANTLIQAAVFNALTADLATGLSTCITKDGQTTVTANLPMGGYVFTGLGAGAANGQSLRYEQLFSTSAVTLLGAMNWVKGADIASDATINLTTATGNGVHVTGTTTITAVTLGSGMWRLVIFDGALTLTHHATNNNLPGAANITTAAGDRALYWADGTTVYCAFYMRANGEPVNLEKTIPQCGRLTLTTALPVTTADVTAATTVYFTPYKGNVVSLYDGTNWVPTIFAELSQTTADSTKSPASVTNNSNYDIFVWNDAGTLRATRGPAWSSDTARGTGAGTTELEVLEGRYVNKIAIANGPAAQRGLYVGTVRSNGSAQINDSVALRHVWNNFNRVVRPMRAVDATNSWTYTTASYRQANNSAANQLDYVAGLSEDAVKASVRAYAANDGSINTAAMGVGVGVDSVTVNSAQVMSTPNVVVANGVVLPSAEYQGNPGIGRHYLAWLEISTASGLTTWSGDAGTTILQTGIFGEVFS